MSELIANIKNGEDDSGGYYRVDDEDHNYEIRIETTDRIHGEFGEGEKSIQLSVEDFFEVMGFSASELDIEINKIK